MIELPNADAATAASPPWDIDNLDGPELRRAYDQLAAFVDWLETCDIRVPACWYTHGWVVRRLAALSSWHEAAHTVESPARDAAEWWSQGLMPLCEDWTDLVGHGGRHVPPDAPLGHPQPVPPLEDWLADAVVAGSPK
jgi:hypothetical protein